MACGATRRRIRRPAATQNEKPRNLDAVARVTLLLVSLTRDFARIITMGFARPVGLVERP
jgi:hypothetical protein